MHQAKLRAIGGSVAVTIPPALLKQLNLGSESRVTLSIEGNRLVVEPARKPQYTLAELMAQCDFSQPVSKDEQDWLDMPSAGREVIE